MSETTTTVQDLIKEIKTGLSQTSASKKDEIRVMQAMLTDTNYEVDVYNKDGVEGKFNPALTFQGMCASVISRAAKIPSAEAEQLMTGYQVNKNEATAMINMSKEFINTFLKTGRKLPLGGRETSDISLSIKPVEASTRLYPQKIGVNDDGTDRYSKTPTTVPAHDSIRVQAPCPPWAK